MQHCQTHRTTAPHTLRTRNGMGAGTIVIGIIFLVAVAFAVSQVLKKQDLGTLFQEAERVNASAIINTGNDITVALLRAATVGLQPKDLSVSRPPREGKFDLFNRTDGYMARPKIPPGAIVDNQIARIELTRLPLSSGSSADMIVIYPLKPGVCRHVNNILNEVSLRTDMLVDTSVAIQDFIVHPADALAGDSGPEMDFYSTIQGTAEEVGEGCIVLDQNIRAYFRILS